MDHPRKIVCAIYRTGGSKSRAPSSKALLFVLALVIIGFSFQALAGVSPVLAAEHLMDDGDDAQGNAHGVDKLRIEQEDKLWVPRDQSEAVLNFLKEFLLKSTNLHQLDPLFASYMNVEDFTDLYFDTPSLQLLAMQSGVRRRGRVNLTNPNDPKNGRELMQMKINNISANQLERGEIKFEIDYPTEIKSADDSHPMLGMVKRSQRKEFKERLMKLGLDPYSMRPILTLRDLRTRFYILRNGKPFMSISHDQARSSLMWAQYNFVEIEPEANEIAFTEADAATRAYMTKINAQVASAIKQKFPGIKTNLTPKYNKAFHALEEQIPQLRFLVRTNMDRTVNLAGAAFMGLALLGGGSFMLLRKASGKTKQPSSRRMGGL